MENRKELTLEELISTNKKSLQEKKNKSLDNIKKLKGRVKTAEGEEKTRLEGLVKLHSDYYKELESITDESIEESAQLRLNKVSSEKTYENLI